MKIIGEKLISPDILYIHHQQHSLGRNMIHATNSLVIYFTFRGLVKYEEVVS